MIGGRELFLTQESLCLRRNVFEHFFLSWSLYFLVASVWHRSLHRITAYPDNMIILVGLVFFARSRDVLIFFTLEFGHYFALCPM